MSSSLQEKLKRLLALATLREGEENDEARVNEARNASFLLLKTVQQNGVRLKFVLPATEAPRPSRPYAQPEDLRGFGAELDELFRRRNQNKSFEDIFVEMARAEERRRRARESAFRPPQSTPPKKNPGWGVHSKTKQRPNPTQATMDEDDDAVLITAKYAGTCLKCGKLYEVGNYVWWRAGAGCIHEGCAVGGR